MSLQRPRGHTSSFGFSLDRSLYCVIADVAVQAASHAILNRCQIEAIVSTLEIVHTMSNKGDPPSAKDQWIESSEMKGLPSRNLVCMQTFAGAWPAIEFG